MSGVRARNVRVGVDPVELSVREGVLFKVLGRVVDIRNRYFLYGNNNNNNSSNSNKLGQQSLSSLPSLAPP